MFFPNACAFVFKMVGAFNREYVMRTQMREVGFVADGRWQELDVFFVKERSTTEFSRAREPDTAGLLED